MEFAIEQACFEVHNLIASDLTRLGFGADRMLHGRYVFPGNTAAADFVDELDARAGLTRLEHHLHLSELTRAAGLLLVGVDVLQALTESLAEADFGLAHIGFDAKLGAHAVDGDFQMKFAHAAQHGLAGLVVDLQAQRRIGLRHLVEGRRHLVLVAPGFRLDGHANDRIWEAHPLQQRWMVRIAQ